MKHLSWSVSLSFMHNIERAQTLWEPGDEAAKSYVS